MGFGFLYWRDSFCDIHKQTNTDWKYNNKTVVGEIFLIRKFLIHTKLKEPPIKISQFKVTRMKSPKCDNWTAVSSENNLTLLPGL